MSSESANNPSVCPKCGSELGTYNGNGRECTNDDCRWIDPLGGGETVAGSVPEGGGVETDTWPSALPRDVYRGEKQRQVIEACARNRALSYPDDKRQIAKSVNASDATVGKALNKARVFLAPGETTLPVPEEPGIQTVVEMVIDHPDAKYGREDFALFADGAGDPSALKAIPDGDIESIRARALSGELPSGIAEDYDADRKTVYDRVVGRAGDDSASSIPPLVHNDGDYILPDEPGHEATTAETVVVCPECPVYWESVPASWEICPRCGADLIQAENAEVTANE